MSTISLYKCLGKPQIAMTLECQQFHSITLLKIATTRIPATTKALITIAQNLITFKALTDTSEHVLFLAMSSNSLYALL